MFAVCRRPTKDGHCDPNQLIDLYTDTYLSAVTQRHIINLGREKIVFKNLTLLFVFVCVNNLFNFKNDPLADEDAVDVA